VSLKQRKLELLRKKREYIKYNKLEFYDPYPFQIEFHNDKEDRRALRAGNQIGKTISGCAQDAFDLTGKYPDWYEGIRYNRPVTLVCGGINNDKTRDLLQKALLGDPVEKETSLGTGWIPKNCLDPKKLSLKRGVTDAYIHAKVKHFTNGIHDGWSTLTFASYESGKMAWMGDTIDIYHLDEEPPMDILGQAGRGCIASGGQIRLTWTPENGITEVVSKVESEWSMHTAEWKDAAGEEFDYEIDNEVIQFKPVKTLKGRTGHITRRTLEQSAKDFPSYQIKMRMKGIPVLGSGLVFEYPEEYITCQPLEGGIPNSWPRIAAIDFGGISKSAHPSAVIYAAWDQDTDTVYVYDGFRLHSADYADVAARMNSRPAWIPVIWPHDGNKEVPGGSTVAKEYQAYGVNMFHTHFTNPPDENKGEGTGGIRIEPGITSMQNRFKDRRIKIYSTFPEWFEEYRQYHLKDGKPVDYKDDLMAATRMACQSLRHAVTEQDVFQYDDEWEDEPRNANSVTGY